MSKQRFKQLILAVVPVLALSGAAPTNLAAANPSTPTPDATHPYVMQQVGNEVATADTSPPHSFSAAKASKPATPLTALTTRPTREVFGFALASSLSDPSFGYPSWNFSLLTTVAFFGLHVMDNGNFANDSGANVWNSGQLSGLVSTAHGQGAKVVVTIILQDFSGGTPHMCSGLAHASTTIPYAVAEVKAKGVDGINVDYEGLNGSCGGPDPSWARHAFTNFMASLRSALPAGLFLSADTYASSAADPVGFYDIGGMTPNTDAFFVMAYDLEYSNYHHPPVNCSSFCLGPTAPLNGYYYNDTSTAQQYLAVTPASKVILGVPYYGRKACVTSAAPNQPPDPNNPSVVADTYLDAIGESTAPGVQAGSYAAHRDANDPTGQERWDTWVNTTMNCTRELYWDDTTSLAPKYDLVNTDNLRGVGLWNLNYGGGAPELWQLLAAKFTAPWTSLGAVLSAGPDAASWGPGRVDVIVKGGNNGLWQASLNGNALSSWMSLGGGLTSDPGVVSWGPNRIDVFARGTDNGLWHMWWNGATWSGWYPMGGVITSGPEVSSWSVNRLDVFARGQNSGLWHQSWNGSSWSGWQSLGGVITSDPTAVSWGPNRIDIFARGQDNGLWHMFWNGYGWSGWESLGGVLTSAPDASSCSAGHLDVFAVGANSSLFQLGFNGAWGTWQSLGGQWTSDAGAVCPQGSRAVELFVRGTDNALWHSRVLGS
jgi:spore germination protein YaaH